MRKKRIAALLAFFFGHIGAHRYYLGQKALGIVYTFIFFIAFMALTQEGEWVLMLIPGILALLDTIIFSTMPKDIFDRKYNKHLPAVAQAAYNRPDYQRKGGKKTSQQSQGMNKKSLEKLKHDAIRAYRRGHYQNSIQLFKRVLSFTPDDPIIHFNIACGYSKLRDADSSFLHLEEAIAKGFPDRNKIFEHEALSWLNSMDEMDVFIKNGYKRSPDAAEKPTSNEQTSPKKEEGPLELKNLPAENTAQPKEEEEDPTENLLDKIEELGKLKEKGILTEEEFQIQKQRWLEE